MANQNKQRLKIINSMLAPQIAPIKQGVKETRLNYTADMDTIGDAGRGLNNVYNTTLQNMEGADERIASLYGQDPTSGLHGAGGGLAYAQNEAMRAGFGLQANALRDFLTQSQMASRAGTREFQSTAMQNRDKSLRDLRTQAATVRQGIPALMHQLRTDARDFAFNKWKARKEFNLAMKELNMNDANADADRDLAEKTAGSGSGGSGGGSGSGDQLAYLKHLNNVSKEERLKIGAAFNQTFQYEKGKGWGSPEAPWRSSFAALQAQGFSPNRAAQIATAWMRTTDNASRTFKDGNADGVWAMLMNRGVSRGTATNIMRQFYGKDWSSSYTGGFYQPTPPPSTPGANAPGWQPI